MMNDSIVKTIWRASYPYLLYLVITVAVQLVIIIPEGIRMIETANTTDYSQIYDALMELIYQKAMLLTLVSGLITVPVLYLFFVLDRKRYKDMNMVSYVSLPLFKYVYVGLFGVFTCLSLNHLIDLTGIINYSPLYQELEENVFESGFIITFLTSALMAPILEEVLFRGLIYKRLRTRNRPIVAAIISSFLFGITHGNLVQFLYAFLAGMLLAFAYEKYKNLWAPILFHFCANTVSILGTDFIDGNYHIWLKLIVFVIETAVLFGIYKIIDNKINRVNKPVVLLVQK